MGNKTTKLVNAQDFVDSLEFPIVEYWTERPREPTGHILGFHIGAMVNETSRHIGLGKIDLSKSDLSKIYGSVSETGDFTASDFGDGTDGQGNTITELTIFENEEFWRKAASGNSD
jgi:hypothetical protein